MTILILILLMFLSGVLGRMGGAGKSGQWYDFLLDTNWRDIGCSLVLIAVIWLVWGLDSTFWYAYTYTAILTFLSFRTYWDRLFGYDCHWFSGLMCGLAAFPMVWIDPIFYIIVPIRAILLAIIWHLLNKKIPQNGILIWRRDIAEEFLRYAASM